MYTCFLLSAWISPAGIWSLPGNLNLLNVSLPIATSKELDLDTNGSTVYISFCLTLLIHVHLIADRSKFSPVQTVVEICKHHHSHLLPS
jgi:hypothetical protein